MVGLLEIIETLTCFLGYDREFLHYFFSDCGLSFLELFVKNFVNGAKIVPACSSALIEILIVFPRRHNK